MILFCGVRRSSPFVTTFGAERGHSADNAIARVALAKVLHTEPARTVCAGGARPH